MKIPPLLADFSHARACKPFCEKYLTLPANSTIVSVFVDIFDGAIINLLNDTFSLLPQRSDSSRVCVTRNIDFDIDIAHVVLKRG